MQKPVYLLSNVDGLSIIIPVLQAGRYRLTVRNDKPDSCCYLLFFKTREREWHDVKSAACRLNYGENFACDIDCVCDDAVLNLYLAGLEGTCELHIRLSTTSGPRPQLRAYLYIPTPPRAPRAKPMVFSHIDAQLFEEGMRPQFDGELRVLSLDGGGTRGLALVTMLKELERQVDEFRAAEYFDVFAGTSTGAIVAAALAVLG